MYSVQFSCLVMSESLWPHELQHARPPCPSPSPRACSDSCPLSQWCHPAISSSVVPFSSWPQSFLASGSFPMSQFFAWGGQSIGVSALASGLPINTQALGKFIPRYLIIFVAMVNGIDSLICLSCFFDDTSLGKFIPRYLILFVAMVNGIDSLISLSDFWLLVYRN